MPDESVSNGGILDFAVFLAVPPRENQAAVAQQFHQLAETWKRDTAHLSNVTKKCTHPAYQRIIGLGLGVVPLILRDLKASQADWFWALTAITGANPIAERDAGNVVRMTEAWLQWGRTKGCDV